MPFRCHIHQDFATESYRLMVANDVFEDGRLSHVEIASGFVFIRHREGDQYLPDDGISVDDNFLRSIVNEAARFGIRADQDAALEKSHTAHVFDLREITSSLLSKINDGKRNG